MCRIPERMWPHTVYNLCNFLHVLLPPLLLLSCCFIPSRLVSHSSFSIFILLLAAQQLPLSTTDSQQNQYTSNVSEFIFKQSVTSASSKRRTSLEVILIHHHWNNTWPQLFLCVRTVQTSSAHCSDRKDKGARRPFYNHDLLSLFYIFSKRYQEFDLCLYTNHCSTPLMHVIINKLLLQNSVKRPQIVCQIVWPLHSLLSVAWTMVQVQLETFCLSYSGVCSTFLPKTKGMQVRLNDNSKLPANDLSLNCSPSLCESCNKLATCPGLSLRSINMVQEQNNNRKKSCNRVCRPDSGSLTVGGGIVIHIKQRDCTEVNLLLEHGF